MWKPPSAPAALAALAVAALAGALAPPARAAVGVTTVAPSAGSTVRDSVVWEAAVTSGTAARVEFLIDGQQRWTEQGAPYRFNGDWGALDTRSLANGSHNLTVRAVARNGRTASASVTVTVANAVPLRVAILSPTAGATLTGTANWEAAVTSGTATQIDFLIDGEPRWVERNGPYRFNGDWGTLDTTTLTNGPHTLGIRATSADGQVATASVVVSVQNNRVVYCLGDLTAGTAGWYGDTTSRGWARQAPYGVSSERVAYDSSVAVFPGCPTIKAELQPNDLDTNGGTDVQRAQLFSNDSLVAQYAGRPSLDAKRGLYRWYSFAFSTNAAFKPQTQSPYPNWNALFSWHDVCTGGCAPQADITLMVATAGPAGGGTVNCGATYTAYATPRLSIELNGGDPSLWPTNGATCVRAFGPTFVAGKRYVVEMGVRWADDGTGSLEVWIDGVRYANVQNVSTMWIGRGVYPIFSNYRPHNSSFGYEITWTNTAYFGGLVKGATRADVALS